MDDFRKRQLIMYLLQGESRIVSDADFQEALKDEGFVQDLITKVDSYRFRKYQQEKGLPESVVEQKENMEREIFNNSDDYDVWQVKESVCDVIFHNNSTNVKLDIVTIIEAAEYNPEIASQIEGFREMYDVVLEFCELKESDRDKVKPLLRRLQGLKDQSPEQYNLMKDTKKLIAQAEKKQEEEIKKAAENSSKMLEGVEPKVVTASDGKQVQVYKIEKQGKNQEEFYVLGRSMYKLPFLFEENAMQKYQEETKAKRPFLSYSLYDQDHMKSFAPSSKRIIFGFKPTEDLDMRSCTSMDGNTFQMGVPEKGEYFRRQEFLPVKEMMARTETYNEIALGKPETILPNMIISATEEPTPDEIEIASKMGLPIVYVNPEAYKSSDKEDIEKIDHSAYNVNELYWSYDRSKVLGEKRVKEEVSETV